MKKFILSILVLAIGIIAVAEERKYSIKSGVMKTVTTILGQKTEGILYFEDYGNLECTQNKAISNGSEKVEMSVISKDGKMYIVHYGMKQVQEMPMQESINYLNLNPDIIKKYNIQDLGKGMIDDKECTKYSAVVSQAGQTANVVVWIWQGIPMKSITSSGGLSITVEVVELQPDRPVDPSIFEIPSF